MAQPRDRTHRFEGPFFGLNTTHDPRQVSAQFATECRNILLSDGRLRPRPTLADFGSGGGLGSNDHITAIYPILEPAQDVALDDYRVLVTTMQLGVFRLWLFRAGSSAPMELYQTQFDATIHGTPTFHRIQNWVYVIHGRVKIRYHVQDSRVQRMFIPAPVIWDAQSPTTFAAIRVLTPVPGAPGPPYVPEYAFTFARRVVDGDDEGELTRVVTIPGWTPGQAASFTFFGPRPDGATWQPPIGIGADSGLLLHVYRREAPGAGGAGGGPPFFTQLTSFTWLGSPINFNDHLSDSNFAGDLVTGPFGPPRNGPPPDVVTTSLWHQGRMWYGTHDARVYYSEIGFPANVDKDAFLDISTATTQSVRALDVIAGQMAIGFDDEIHIMSGTLRAATNDIQAVGGTPPGSQHQVYKSRASVGPQGPSSFVLAGNPARLYFSHNTGFYAFDGSDAFMISDLIKPTWREFLLSGETTGVKLSDGTLHVSYADDPFAQILYVCRGMDIVGLTLAPPGAEILAYHYGVNRGDGIGAWSEIRVTDHELDAPDFATVVAGSSYELADADQIGEVPDGRLRYSPMLVGSFKGKLLVGLVRPNNKAAARYRYATGRHSFIEGSVIHLYETQLFIADSGDFPDGSDVGATTVAIEADGGAPIPVGSFRMDQYKRLRFMVGKTVQNDARMILESVTNPIGWRPEMGILGWTFDVERASP